MSSMHGYLSQVPVTGTCEGAGPCHARGRRYSLSRKAGRGAIVTQARHATAPTCARRDCRTRICMGTIVGCRARAQPAVASEGVLAQYLGHPARLEKSENEGDTAVHFRKDSQTPQMQCYDKWSRAAGFEGLSTSPAWCMLALLAQLSCPDVAYASNSGTHAS